MQICCLLFSPILNKTNLESFLKWILSMWATQVFWEYEITTELLFVFLYKGGWLHHTYKLTREHLSPIPIGFAVTEHEIFYFQSFFLTPFEILLLEKKVLSHLTFFVNSYQHGNGVIIQCNFIFLRSTIQ